MQIEVHDEEKRTVFCDVERRGKKAEGSFSDYRVVFSRILPNGSIRPAMSERDVIKLSIGRDNDAVRAVDIDRHTAGIDLSIDSCAVRSETDERDLVG